MFFTLDGLGGICFNVDMKEIADKFNSIGIQADIASYESWEQQGILIRLKIIEDIKTLLESLGKGMCLDFDFVDDSTFDTVYLNDKGEVEVIARIEDNSPYWYRLSQLDSYLILDLLKLIPSGKIESLTNIPK